MKLQCNLFMVIKTNMMTAEKKIIQNLSRQSTSLDILVARVEVTNSEKSHPNKIIHMLLLSQHIKTKHNIKS